MNNQSEPWLLPEDFCFEDCPSSLPEALTTCEKRWKKLWKRAKKLRFLITLGGLLMVYAKGFSPHIKDRLKKALKESEGGP